MRKFCDELWRIAKFLVISFVVSVPIAYLNGYVTSMLFVSGSPDTGLWLSLLSYVYLFLTNVGATLANRYFTVRATEKWFIAVPMMVGAQFLWNLLISFSSTLSLTWMNGTIESYMMAAQIESVLWVIVSYLLQRCVIYCHTLDTNGWYRRFHSTYDEEGENPDEQECNPGD